MNLSNSTLQLKNKFSIIDTLNFKEE